MSWYLSALKKFAVFGGRARRMEYWYFMLFSTLFAIPLIIVDGLFIGAGAQSPEPGHSYGLLTALYQLAMMIPGLAVFVRRMHDIGKSGWWFFLGLIPLIGAIVLLVFCIREGQRGANEYGEDPKGSDKGGPLSPAATPLQA